MIPQSLDSPFAKKPALYVVAAAIREAYETGGELSAAIELRRITGQHFAAKLLRQPDAKRVTSVISTPVETDRRRH